MASYPMGRAAAAAAAASAHGQGQPPRHPPSLMHCNRCRQPLASTLFVLTCDCVFCEDCTYAHFANSTQCPSCRKALSQNDFLELLVAEPSTASDAAAKNAFQYIFTKRAAGSKGIGPGDLGYRVLREMDESRRHVKFLLRQLVNGRSSQEQRIDSMARAMEAMKSELTLTKQMVLDQQQESARKIGELQCVVQDKTHQVEQFKAAFVQKGMNLGPPSSSHSHGSGGQRGPSGRAVAHSHHYQQHPQPQPHPASLHSTPILSSANQQQPAFVALPSTGGARPVSVNIHAGRSAFTPIQAPPPPGRSAGSGISVDSMRSVNSYGTTGTVPMAPRYSFSRGSSSGGAGSAGQYQHPFGSVPNMSPSNRFSSGRGGGAGGGGAGGGGFRGGGSYGTGSNNVHRV